MLRICQILDSVAVYYSVKFNQTYLFDYASLTNFTLNFQNSITYYFSQSAFEGASPGRIGFSPECSWAKVECLC